MNINKVSQSIASQSPEFLQTEYPLFNKFIEYYYRSQEKTGLGQNIINNFLQYLDIDKLDVGILNGSTKIVESIDSDSDTIVVESVDSFLDTNGSILIGDEVIYYESTTSSPNIALSPGISYDQVKLKWTDLAQIYDLFDGSRVIFPLTSQSSPVSPPTAQHLIISLYGKILRPNVDYTVENDNVTFTSPPRARLIGDDPTDTYILFLSGFVENAIVEIDNISSDFGENKVEFNIRRNGVDYEPIADEYILAVYDNNLLVPKKDYYTDGSLFIFETAPLNGRSLSLYSIEAPIPDFGSGAVGYSRIDNNGQITSIEISQTGSGYQYNYPPKVSISSENGFGAAASALVNGVKNLTLLNGGRGYSDTNPPTIVIEEPTTVDSVPAKLKAVVTNGAVSSIEVESSGSGYTFIPRVSFKQPGGAKLGTATITDGSLSGTIAVTNGGEGYTTAPEVYIDEPTGDNPVKAVLTAVLTDGVVTSINIVNAGQGYTTTPRVAIIDPVGAQILETVVDSSGRVTNIELLSGGIGYDDIPSVYIVGGGGTGATATASVFNGKITDINITNFGSGYSQSNPPTIIIQNPPQAKASVEIGLNEVTGFKIFKSGAKYEKAKFVGCARAASGIIGYTENGNAIFSNNTTASSASVSTEVKCLDALFVKRLLDKYTEQFLPDVPELDYTKIDVRNAIKSVKNFYSSKGTSFSIAYLFKLLYGEEVTVSYPKDQITKPSAATWSIDTILRATLVSGNPVNIKDGLLTQESSITDPNVNEASALIENYIAIRTSETDIYELVLSEETIQGKFIVPYKTKLAEPLNTTDSIITVDSTIGWPERNGEIVIGGSEIIQYKEKSLNQFIECTRSVNGIVEDWDSATEVSSNLVVYVNKGTSEEVILNIVGIVDAQQTVLTDTGSYYLAGDKLTVSKLGGTSEKPELKTWLYNVKKLLEVQSITFGGINNRFATVTCDNDHGLLVGDQVTIYGANPNLYNGTFLVTSRDSATVFQYQLPQPAEVAPQGNILVSVDLNKGKSTNTAILNSIGPYTTNVQNSFFNDQYVYVASTGIPNYNIGPFPGSALLPGNQRKLNRFPLNPETISVKNTISPGPIGTWINGTSVWSYKSETTKTFGPITSINIVNSGSDYDASSPPNINITGGGGSGATGTVTVNGSITEIIVNDGGSGYTSSPLVSIVGGGGSGAAATAIVTKGVVSSILMNTGGSGYTSQPTITIVGGGGSGAAATASVRGPVKSISVTNGGSSYTSKPDVTLSSGSGAVAQAIVSNGRIISVAIISAGSGYTTAPEVTIQGAGFGAVARATIDTDGENAGRVTGIEIINRGINYVQGTTVINLTSVGSGAVFDPSVFEWTYNLQETAVVDSAKGSVFSGYNTQYGGEYAHISNPQRLRYILGDNLFEDTEGNILEQEDQIEHSPIIGWAFDGNPIYGPYGYSDPTNQSSNIKKINSSYKLKTNLVLDPVTNPIPVRTAGPLLSDEPAGTFVEDYEYSFGYGDLDQYNGRFCKTPDFPDGRYCYFITIDNTDNGNPVFPYVLGPSFNSIVDSWNLNKNAIQQNIPTGVVRYRDPYENVDIDVERAPNISTNTLTTESGDILLFDVEDENKDGVISQDEIDDPDQLLEESPLQLFDYFPKVKFDSRVDIEVETTTKFEDASVTGFIIEDAGKSYQVDDILVFDNENTDGTGVSARVSKIKGEKVTSYTFETVEDNFYGVLTTQTPHNLIVGDTVYVDYSPIMDETNKTFVVRQLKGVEEIIIEQTGSGYDAQIPPTIIIDGDGESAELSANVSTTGSITEVDIVNAGSGYVNNPRVILSHPQVFKKANYYVSLIENQNYVKVNDVFVNDDKEVFFCGKTLDASSNEVAFVSKFSELGVKEWEKTLESLIGETYTEFLKLDVSGDNIWLVGQNKPNILSLSAYNPDIVLAKYVQTSDGLDANLIFQKGYAGISGSTRADNVTAIRQYSDTRYIIGGYTNTNSSNPQDAFIASIDSTGDFAAKRKIVSNTGSEKITDLVVLNDAVYFVMETAASDGASDSKIAFGKVLVGTSAISIEWIKEINNSIYSFRDTSLVADEFNEFYISASLALKSDNTIKDSFWVGKFDSSGDSIWNYRYVVPSGNNITVASKSVIDIFGDLNIAYTRTNTTTNQKTVDTVKLGYDGVVKKHTNNNFDRNNIEGITVNSITVDNSGDPYVFGQTQWNRNEILCEFASDATDKTGHYTLETLSDTGSDAVKYEGGYAKIFGKDATAGRLLTVDTVSAADASRTEGTYTIGASDYTTDASGTGATFSIAVDGSGAATVTITNPGSGYTVNETFTITDANLGGGGGASLTFDAATVSAVDDWVNGAIKVPGTSLADKLNGNFTIEFMLYKDAAETNDHSQTEQTLFAIGDGTDATGGLWLYYNIGNGKLELAIANNSSTINSATPQASTQTTMFVDDSWQFIGLKRDGNAFTAYVNGIQVVTATISDTDFENKNLYFGNIPGANSVEGEFRSNEQGQFYMDNLRIRNRAITPDVPSDVTALPPTDTFALAFDWTDDDWFTDNLKRYDYIDYVGWGLKTDKDSDSIRLGDQGLQTNTNLGLVRTSITPVTGSVLTITNTQFSVGSDGLQGLDFEDANISMSQNTETLTYSTDQWSSRTATVPAPGSRKLKISAVVEDRYYMKTTSTLKVDNVQELTINQDFNVTIGSKLVLNNTSGTFINSGYVLRVDNEENKVYLAVNNNSWSNDLDTGRLSTEKFDESDTYGIVGKQPNDTNVIVDYTFADKVNTTPGTFDFDLADYNLDRTDATVGNGNLDEFATFKDFNINDYRVKIVEIGGSSAFIPGSVIDITSDDISFNAAKSTARITNLTGVTKITLISTLDKILQVTAVSNTDEVYVITSKRHYLSVGDNIFVDGNPTREVGGVAYDEYDGSFVVDTVVSNKEFIYKLPVAAQTDPSATPGDVSIFAKSPILKMYYGHQYLFDVSHSSMLGSNLSFSKDNLFKLEYSFNSIERIGTPGITGIGQPTPTVKLKVDREFVTNISYYFDPSRIDDGSPIDSTSYLDIVDSPYLGTFVVTQIDGASITQGANVLKFLLANEPEGNANALQTTYNTSSKKAVGSIGDIRLINTGGFYSKLPIVTNIISSRKIERAQINEPGTEYFVGTYNSVPIQGDGEGGFVSITVADGTNDEGETIPGQIQSVTITSPGKGYTTASIDIEGIEGILGPGLTGSGADIEIVIPEFGTGAVIFAKGDNVGKIKKLKNNNFGYDYTHDYTLRPEITFPINAQLTSTSILDSITITDPGSGYSQAPAVVITGGGGSGAIAEATIKNGRIDGIVIKDPGSGYSSAPTIELKSSFNYVINTDLGLLQFAFPHGITNGSEVTLNVVDTGEGTEFPLASGAIGRLNGTTTYYAITGAANSLESDQMKLAITADNAELGDAIAFVNAGTGRQQVLTQSFGAAATANVITSTFLEGEQVYQGDSLDVATATGYVSTNEGWQIGPRILKIVNYDGTFVEGESVTGVISKSSGVISDVNIAKGVLEIGSITKTTGQFIDDVGKPSEIIQKIQDSYYYQDFSYAVKSSVSIGDWKDILVKNVHPASFKVFGELTLEEYGFNPNKEIDFEITKSVELAREAIVPNIQNFALVEPIYSEFNNTEVLFRQKRLTSSENILTSVVQRLDDISDLFDGVRTQFPLTVNNGDNVIANANQLLIVLNGVAQTPDTSFEVQGDSIIFAEPPSPPASVKYVNIEISQVNTKRLTFTFTSGIFPNIGNSLSGIVSGARMTVTGVAGNVVSGFVTEGTFIVTEQCQVEVTGFSGTLSNVEDVQNDGLFIYNEQVTNLSGDTAKVETVNLETGQETPVAKLRYGIGAATTTVEVVSASSETDAPVADGTFTLNENYQIGSEIVTVTSVTNGSESTTIVVTRGLLGTAAVSHQENSPIYSTEIEITNALTLSKTAGTYQSTPGLFNIQLNDYIIGSSSGVVALVTATSAYSDPVTGEFIEQVNISAGSSFFGLLFNRLASVTYPNVILDDISKSQVSIVDFDDNLTAFNTDFPSSESISNNIIVYTGESGDLEDNEYIRNYAIEYGTEVGGTFGATDNIAIRKLTFEDSVGSGFLSQGQVIRTEDTKAEVVGYNQAVKTVYLGKIGRCLSTGEDYFDITFNGDAQLDTDQKRFGTASLLLDGTGDYLSIPTSTEFGFGTDDFTIEAWIRPSTIAGGAKAIFDFRTTGTEISPYLYLDGADLKYYVNGSVAITGTATFVVDTWYHVTVSRSSGTTKMFVDGVQDGSDYTDSNDYGSTKPLRIGSDYNNTSLFNGHIDETRVSTNARYTAAFTASTGMFQGDTDTVLLVHFDGEDGQTYTEDWSGGESLTDGEDFNNGAILATYYANNQTAPVVGFDGKTHRYYDAADLIEYNKDFISKEAVYATEQNYSLTLTASETTSLESGIVDALGELIEDLRNGSNSHMWDESATYVDRTANPITINTLTLTVTQHVWLYDKVREMLQYIINNVLWTVTGSHGIRQITDTTITDSSTSVFTQLTPSTATYDPATGDMVITVNSHGLTTSSRIAIAAESIVFTCTSDDNDRPLAHPRKTDTKVYNQVLAVTSFTTNTFTINVGASPDDAQFVHTFVSAETNAITVLDYTTSDCADVWSTVGNLMDILTDTLEQANLGTPVDHLDTITKVSPAIEFQGGTVDALYETQFTTSYHDSTNDILYSNRIDAETRNRFYDAANLIRANTSVIVDKASFDLLDRYPDLASDMPRNSGGSGDGTRRCKTDLTLIVDALAKDIQYGGNKYTVRAAKFYLDNKNELQHIRLQVWQSVYAHNRLAVYLKQAVTGDLTYDNTDNIITGDWGITNDAGGCADVKSAIDTLVGIINDAIAPTNNDYNIAADRLYFNRDYIAEEIAGRSGQLGLLGSELQYTIVSGSFSAINYDLTDYQTYVEDFIIAAISDLQTGGNNSVIAQMQKFLNIDKKITTIDEELYAFFYAHESLKTLTEKAIKNLLYTAGSSVTGDQYAAVYTNNAAYRDSESPTDINEVWYRMRDLIDDGIDTLFPGGTEATSAVKNILYNTNYYKNEISSLVNNQFGSNSWEYDSFVDDLINNVQYDLLTSDTDDTQVAYTLDFSVLSGTFVVGETITDGSTTATVLDFSGSTMVIGDLTGTLYNDEASITAPSGATATIAVGGVSLVHEWYNNFSNVKTIESARAISSLVEGSVDNTNLWTLPEQFDSNWTTNLTTVTANNAYSPDGIRNAEKVVVTETTGQHYIERSYALTAYTTFDSDGVRFDSGTTTFDAGANNSTQTFTASMFVKKAQYENVRFSILLDDGVNKTAHFSVNLTTGSVGTLFADTPITVIDNGVIPIGNGWYRLYITAEFGFGFGTLKTRLNVLSNATGALDYTGTNNDTKINPSNAGTYSYFGGGLGRSSDVGSGKYVVGSPYQTRSGFTYAGTVRIYDLDGTNEVEITPSRANNYQYFGWSVAVDNNKVVVGAYGDNAAGSYAGSVYIFDLDGSNEIRIDLNDIIGDAASTYDYFGYDVEIANSTIFVGAPYYDGSGRVNDGGVFVFDINGNYLRTIQASDRLNYDNFGFSIAATSTKVVIGAPYDDDGVTSSGTVFVYDHDGTNEVKVKAATPTLYDQFGMNVATDGNKIVIGSGYARRNSLTYSGAAWITDMDGSNQILLTAPVSRRAAYEYYGWSVDIRDGKVAVGARYDETTITNQGVVYLYDEDGTNEQEIVAYDATSSDYFGSTVKLFDGYLYATAERDNFGRGSAYIIDISGGSGLYAWGAKLTNQSLGTYTSTIGTKYYTNTEYNIKSYVLERLTDYIERALSNNLVSPSTESSFYKFYDNTVSSNYNTDTIMTLVRSSLNVISNQLVDSDYYNTLTENNAISIPTKIYGDRDIPVGISGEIVQSDYVYALNSNVSSEIQQLTLNEAKIAKVYKRFRIDGTITDGPFTMNETVQKQGDPTVTGVVYAFYQDDNYKYLDVAITAGTWAITDTIVGDENSTTAQISAIESRLHVIDVLGSFVDGVPFQGYTSTETAEPSSYTGNNAAVTDNTGGRLTVDTATLNGFLESTSVVYPSSSREYLEVDKYEGFDINVGQRVASTGHVRLTVTVDAALDSFTAGNRLYRIVSGGKDTDNYGIITEYDSLNNYIYFVPVLGSIGSSDVVGDYGGGGDVLVGEAQVTSKTTFAGAASARVQLIQDSGLRKRIYLTDIKGSFASQDGLRGPNDYRSAIVTKEVLKARVKRFFKGFDGVQTTFDLTTGNGTQYLPDPDGHMMIFVNGILQPPGASSAYTAFSDKIQFSEPPELGASFTGFYLGKLRQLDDIGFEFDSLRQSFNLKRNDVFYSLTLTEGVQSSVIRPENNIIVSINGVLQEPGVGFEIVGSRIIFSEIPRFGSTFVAFSYVGSEADVDSDEVVPPVEAGDFLDIEGEVSEREVAVIESSNSLITFDYLGSVFGQNALASANLTNGFIERVSVTSPGSGYTSRPVVRLDSISGFDGQVKALVGVSGVTITNIGSGYKNPLVDVETTVPDDWTAPNLADYGEEIIDPEVIP